MRGTDGESAAAPTKNSPPRSGIASRGQRGSFCSSFWAARARSERNPRHQPRAAGPQQFNRRTEQLDETPNEELETQTLDTAAAFMASVILSLPGFAGLAAAEQPS